MIHDIKKVYENTIIKEKVKIRKNKKNIYVEYINIW